VWIRPIIGAVKAEGAGALAREDVFVIFLTAICAWLGLPLDKNIFILMGIL
jgi:hypothetical protein